MEQFSLIMRQDLDAAALLSERQARVNRFVKSKREEAQTYYASPELVAAADVALTLGRPLLLTGEPGSGKTLAASWLANRLGLLDDEHFHEFQVRSDSRARDACYDFDAVSWFRQSQLAGAEIDKKAFVTAGALGKAFGWRGGGGSDTPHLVLIDEIDKASRDFPNDLLLELDEMRFAIAETGEQIGPSLQRPIVVITSNAERRLPDPFLRRCVTHQLEIEPETLVKILEARLAAYGSEAADTDLVTAAGAFWGTLSALEGSLLRKPTVAEFWQWLVMASTYPVPSSPNLAATLKAQRGIDIGKLSHIGTLFNSSDLSLLTR